jgi:hypothetical protein
MRLFITILLLAFIVIAISFVAFVGEHNLLQQQLVLPISITIGAMILLGGILLLSELKHNRRRQHYRQAMLALANHGKELKRGVLYIVKKSKRRANKSTATMEHQVNTVGLVEPAVNQVIAIGRMESATSQVFADQSEELPPLSTPPHEVKAHQLSNVTSPSHNLVALAKEVVQPEISHPKIADTPKIPAFGYTFQPIPVESHLVAAIPRSPADQILYLAQDFDISEIKRILRLWKMNFEYEDSDRILARWRSEDGTEIEIFDNEEQGSPYMEIRGPMADELAEYLPQDLPVFPKEPDSSELI